MPPGQDIDRKNEWYLNQIQEFDSVPIDTNVSDQSNERSLACHPYNRYSKVAANV